MELIELVKAYIPHSDWWGIISAVMAVIALPYMMVTRGVDFLHRQLHHAKDLRYWRMHLKGGTQLEQYRRQVGNLENRIADFYGHPFSFRAFDKSLLLAMVYPIVLFWVSWIISGRVLVFEGLGLHMDPLAGLPIRLFNAAATLSYIFMYYTIFRNLSEIGLVATALFISTKEKVWSGTSRKTATAIGLILRALLVWFFSTAMIGGALSLSRTDLHFYLIVFMMGLGVMFAAMARTGKPRRRGSGP